MRSNQRASSNGLGASSGYVKPPVVIVKYEPATRSSGAYSSS